MNGLAMGLLTVSPFRLTVVRVRVMSYSVPPYVSRKMARTSATPTFFSGLTEKG